MQRIGLQCEDEGDGENHSGDTDDSDQTASRPSDVDRRRVDRSDGREADLGRVPPDTFMGWKGSGRVGPGARRRLVEAVDVVRIPTHTPNGSDVRCPEGRGLRIDRPNLPTAVHRYALGVDRSVVEQSEARRDLVDRFRSDDDWIALETQPLSVGELYDWAVRPDCGAVVVFSGTIRDHSVEGSRVRSGVEFLDYEAYAPEAVARMRVISEQARSTWPNLGRIAMVHRIGRMELGESSVLVVVSAPHRPEAFEAARYAIDALKSSVPIWKHETWSDGSDWGLGAQQIAEVPAPGEVPPA